VLQARTVCGHDTAIGEQEAVGVFLEEQMVMRARETTGAIEATIPTRIGRRLPSDVGAFPGASLPSGAIR
jgi:hypothetical protein